MSKFFRVRLTGLASGQYCKQYFAQLARVVLVASFFFIVVSVVFLLLYFCYPSAVLCLRS